MNDWKPLLLLALLSVTAPVTAQFRSEKRSADKAFELHAYNLAIDGYKRALAVRPDDGETLARLGDAYHMLNQLDTARMYYDRALDDPRVSPPTLLNYAQTLKSLGRYEDALPVFLLYAREGDAEVGNQYARSCDFAVQQRSEDAGYTVATLGINSSGADFGANVPLSGQFVFNSARLAEDFDGIATNRPYVARIGGGGELSSPVPVVFNYQVAAGASIGPVSYSPDGRTVVFSRNNFTAGTRMVPEAGITLSLLIADVNEAGEWTNVRPLPVNGNDFNTGFGTFGTDASTIYFASDRPGGEGGYDLYRLTDNGNNWTSAPENLGTGVNTRGDEITPYFDGNSLYFSSDYHQGMGGFDVFRADMAAGTPSGLYHLGGSVNSPRDDMGFVYSRPTNTGYFTSNRAGGAGQEDLYRAELRTTAAAAVASTPATDAVAAGPTASVPEGVVANTPVPFGTVRGYVTDINTGRAVAGATVVITQRATDDTASAETDSEGAYYVSVQPATVYDVSVDAPMYESITFPVTTDDGTNVDVFGNIKLLSIQESASSAAKDTTVAMATTPAATTPSVPAVDGTGPAQGSIAVQLASLTEQPDLAAYAAVAPLGTVYSSVGPNGRYRIRMGPFADREQALVAVRQAANLGYPGSFVVTEDAATIIPATTTPVAPPASTVEAVSPATPSGTQSAYRVQLGAFSKPANFDRTKAEQLGTLGSELRGELTVFYVSTDDLETARQTARRAVAAGYSGAYVLKLTDGRYVKP